MNKNLRIKGLVILGVILVCIYGIIGLPRSWSQAVENWNNNIKLGLDLKGGSHLVLQVQVQDAFKAAAADVIDRLKDEFAKQSVAVASMDNTEPPTIESAGEVQVNIKGVPIAQTSNVRQIIAENFPDWVLTAVNSSDYRLTMKPSAVLDLRRTTVERTIRTIETRINSLGLAESAVQPRGRTDAEAEILVQLPGVDDPARIKQLIQTAAVLELYEVKDGPFSSQEEAMSKHGGILPLNTKLIRGTGSQESTGWLLVSRNPVVRGSDLRDAKPTQGEFAQWETQFTLSQDAARRFERFTEANIGNRLAIVLDNQWRTAPTIQNKIGDTGVITNVGSQEQASDLALVLRAGSLPASLRYLEERTVGPSLGADSIRQGITAGVVGLAIVIICMLAYYKRAGVNATIALLLNSLILLAAVSYFEAVLTLPGIAGIILSIGMAVDSNVLIFERIREELRAGKSVLAAINAGFSKAFLTIIDTHITTVVSCAFLFMFGTGPVKGFAVTLVIGLIANVFTAVFVSKFIFDFENAGKREVQELSI
jgi:preprotein translocase subunit SecD